jgi:ribosome-associated heat shock protein Hsp15
MAVDDGAGQAGSMRLDRFLWFARLAKTRQAAQALAVAGTLRLDGRRIDRAHAPVRIGSVIAFVQGSRVRVIRIAMLPERRGPAAEAAMLYDELANPVDVPEARA